jgi:hypothetical protein
LQFRTVLICSPFLVRRKWGLCFLAFSCVPPASDSCSFYCFSLFVFVVVLLRGDCSGEKHGSSTVWINRSF